MFCQNYSVIITGGSSGIGAATAKALSQIFEKVYVLDKQTPKFELGKINYLKCDVSDFEEVKTNIDEIAKTTNIGYLFTNAGIIKFGSLTETSIDEIKEITSVNLLGTIFTLKACLPYMMKNKFGKVVLMGSDQSFIGKKGMSIYGATKGAIAQLTKSTALDYAKYNINVNCVCPGTIETENYDVLIEEKAKELNMSSVDLKSASLKTVPLKRNGTPKDVADLVEFLFSEKSSFLTGSIIPIDGGYIAQ